ncbi:hypothetical protein Tco_1560274, partial [Tanacetum coccineum]
DNSKENTDDSLEQHQMTNTGTSSFESPLKIDKDWKEKFFYPANHVESVNKIEKPVKKNNDAAIIEDWVSDDEDEVESPVVVKKNTIIPTAAKIEKPVRKQVRYAEMYRHVLSVEVLITFNTAVLTNRGHMAPRAVLMKTGLKTVNTARPVNTVRSVNTGRPFSTASTINSSQALFAVPLPHPLILKRPTPLDLSYSGLEEFKQPEVNEYGPRDSSVKPTTGCNRKSENSKENTNDSLKQQQKTNSSSVKSPLKRDNDAPIIEDWVSDDEDEVEPISKVKKKTVIPTTTKKEFVKPETPVRRSVSNKECFNEDWPKNC